MKKLFTALLAVLMVLTLAACGGSNEPTVVEVDPNAKSEGSMTYAEYVAAEDGTDITVEGFVTATAYNAKYGNVNLYMQDGNGAYYVYRMNVTEEEAAKLVPGTKIVVKGSKGSWGGELEVAEGTGTFSVSSEETWTPAAKDVTSLMNDESLIDNQNQFVSISGAKVVESTYDEKDDEGNVVATHTDAFWYGWENNSEKGSNADLYFNIEVDGTVFNVCVESDECPEGTAVYSAVEALNIGDTVDLEGYLYWYWGANLHVHSAVVK